MNEPDSAPIPFAETIAIAGVGLIGGSIAAALKSRGFEGKIFGVGRNASRMAEAQRQGLIDEFADDVKKVTADFWVFCTPVDRIADGILAVRSIPNKTVLVTDAGSVKGAICDAVRGRLPAGVTFIGAHPLAGSEKRGFEWADAELFVDRLCVLTPEETTPSEQLARLRGFWQFLGMRLAEMNATAHDNVLAETSHLPHVVASVLAATLAPQNVPYTATGFADTTRIAAGDPELWTAILMQNHAGICAALARFSDQLAEFRKAFDQRDAAALKNFLELAKTKRETLR